MALLKGKNLLVSASRMSEAVSLAVRLIFTLLAYVLISEQEVGSELLRLKKRFLKDHEEQSRIFFAKRHSRLRQMREVRRVFVWRGWFVKL